MWRGTELLQVLHIDGEWTIKSDILVQQDAEVQYYFKLCYGSILPYSFQNIIKDYLLIGLYEVRLTSLNKFKIK
jgi:hypothetical protein